MTKATGLWRAWSSNASANGRCLSCRIRKSGEGFFRAGESLLHTGSGGASGTDVFLKKNADDQSHRIVEGIVVKRKQALFELRVRKSASNFSGILSAAFHRVIVGGPEGAYLLLKQRDALECCHIRSRFDPLNGTFVPLRQVLTRESADCAGFFSCAPAGSPAGTAKRTANIRFIRIERQKYESGRIFALQFAPALLPGRGRRRAPGSRLRPIGRWPLCSLQRFCRNRVWRLGSKDMRRKTRRGQVVRGQEHIGSACAGRKRFLRLGR